MISLCASRCRTSSTALADFGDYVCASGRPWNGSFRAALNVPSSLLQLRQPRSIQLIVLNRLEAFQQAMYKLGALGDGKGENLGKELLGSRHGLRVPLRTGLQ